MASVLIQFAYLNDKQTLISIDTAGKDQHLKYYCTECLEELTLRHGMDKRKHFAHRPNTHCEVSRKGCGESIIHKYWKQYYAESEYIWIPRELVYETNLYILNPSAECAEKCTVTNYGLRYSTYQRFSNGNTHPISYEIQMTPHYFEKVKIVSAVKEKEFTLRNGRKIRPDVLLTLDTGEKIALEIWVTNKKTQTYEYAYAELGIEAYEIQITKEGRSDPPEYLYSKRKKELIEGVWNKKMNAFYLKADDFMKSIYRSVARWDKANWFNRITVPRYTFHLINKTGQKFLLRTTYRTFKQVKKSYGHMLEIELGGSLERRVLKDDLQLLQVKQV